MKRFVVLLCKLVAWLPFWAIWGLADIFYVLLYYVVRYRRKVVHENLVRSFPEKTPDEIKQITKKYYHHLSDIGLETIKFSRMTEREIDDRLKVNNLDLLEEYYQKGKSIIMLGQHHNNWEWSGATQRFIKLQYLVVYNPLRTNPYMEKFITESRERFGAKSIPIHQSFRTALNLNKAERPSALVLAADQAPPVDAQFWTTFLNQETSFFAGPMKIAGRTNLPLVLHHTRKVGRSRYEVFYYKLIENPTELQPEEILLTYVRKLEEIIQNEPEYWLWSHRRWKHKRPADMPIYPSGQTNEL